MVFPFGLPRPKADRRASPCSREYRNRCAFTQPLFEPHFSAEIRFHARENTNSLKNVSNQCPIPHFSTPLYKWRGIFCKECECRSIPPPKQLVPDQKVRTEPRNRPRETYELAKEATGANAREVK
jgi:hypothetical protein